MQACFPDIQETSIKALEDELSTYKHEERYNKLNNSFFAFLSDKLEQGITPYTLHKWFIKLRLALQSRGNVYIPFPEWMNDKESVQKMIEKIDKTYLRLSQ